MNPQYYGKKRLQIFLKSGKIIEYPVSEIKQVWVLKPINPKELTQPSIL